MIGCNPLWNTVHVHLLCPLLCGFSFFSFCLVFVCSAKSYVVVSQKNCITEAVLLRFYNI